MRRFAFVLTVCAALAAPNFARAQFSDEVAASSAAMRAACVGNNLDPAECACIVGFFAGRMAEDEFHLIAVVNQYIDAQGNIRDMAAAQQALQNTRIRLGINEARFAQIMQRFTELTADSAYGDRVCMALRAQSDIPSNAFAPK